MSQEVELSDSKHTLLQVEGQPIGGEDGDQYLEALPMLLFGLAVYSVII
jgi:hypothetical protein